MDPVTFFLIVIAIMSVPVAALVARLMERALLREPIKITVLGESSAGKTVLLSGIHQRFEVADNAGLKVVTDPASRNLLMAVQRELRRGNFPPPTQRGEGNEWAFKLLVQGAVRDFEVVRLTYYDYAGELLPDLFDPRSQESDAAEALQHRINESDVLVGLLDGFEIWKLLTNPQDNDQRSRINSTIENLVRLCSEVNKPVHFLLTKWDIFALHHISLDSVVVELTRFEYFARFIAASRITRRPLRLIPVSSIGIGNVVMRERDDGQGIEPAISEGHRVAPFQVELPLACILPDIVKSRLASSGLLSMAERVTRFTPTVGIGNIVSISLQGESGQSLLSADIAQDAAGVTSTRQALLHTSLVFRREIDRMEGRFPASQLSPAPTLPIVAPLIQAPELGGG